MHSGVLSTTNGGGFNGMVPQQPGRLTGMLFRGFGNPRLRGFPDDGQQPDPFGFNRQPVTTPPYYPGAPVGPDTPAPMMGSYNPAATQTPTAGAPGGYVDPSAGQQRQATGFNKPGGWADRLGQLGTLLMATSGNPAMAAYAQQNQSQRFQMQQFERAQALRAQQAQYDRDLDNRTWLERQIWERQNPAPMKNDTVNDYEFLRQKLGEEAANQYLRNFAAGPITAVDGFDAAGNPTKTFVPRGSLNGGGFSGGASGPIEPAPTKPVGKLRPYKGGAPSQGGGTFR